MDVIALSNASRIYIASILGPLANTFEYQFGKLTNLINMHLFTGKYFYFLYLY